MEIVFVWGSERFEKAFLSKGSAPVEAARLSNSRCSGETACSVEDDAPIVAETPPQKNQQFSFQNSEIPSFFLIIVFISGRFLEEIWSGFSSLWRIITGK